MMDRATSDSPVHRVLRLGARGSLLSRRQSRMVADALEQAHPGLNAELIVYRTSGDRLANVSLADQGGKGLFTKELELALLAGEIDLAVHSMKDVPVTMPLVGQENLLIAAVPPREDPADVLITADGRPLTGLRGGARVGTGSLRRRCQILQRRPDVIVEAVRGNIDTRLRKMAAGEFDALVMALSGLRRAGLFDASRMTVLTADEFLPAAGQGALALQCRRDDPATRRLVEALDNSPSALCVHLERRVVSELAGDCHSPLAALATVGGAGTDSGGARLRLRAAVGAAGGGLPVVRAEAVADSADAAGADRALREVVGQLNEQGAWRLLHGDAPRPKA